MEKNVSNLMPENMPEKMPDTVDDLQLAAESLAAFPARGAAVGADVTERLAAVAELCRSVDAVLDSLVVQVAAKRPRRVGRRPGWRRNSPVTTRGCAGHCSPPRPAPG